MGKSKEIVFDKLELKVLKSNYTRAKNNKKDTVIYKGIILNIIYAKYLIEHLEDKLKK